MIPNEYIHWEFKYPRATKLSTAQLPLATSKHDGVRHPWRSEFYKLKGQKAPSLVGRYYGGSDDPDDLSFRAYQGRAVGIDVVTEHPNKTSWPKGSSLGSQQTHQDLGPGVQPEIVKNTNSEGNARKPDAASDEATRVRKSEKPRFVSPGLDDKFDDDPLRVFEFQKRFDIIYYDF